MAQADNTCRLLGDSIRLLTLRSGIGEEDIQCILQEVRLQDKPVYSALSYTWGPPGDLYKIWVNRMPVAVRKNLYSLLCHLRLPNSNRTVWVDALCINQDNVYERNHQVEMMGQIFEKSERVFVWLGEAEYDSDTAMDFLMELPRDEATSIEGCEPLPTIIAESQSVLLADGHIKHKKHHSNSEPITSGIVSKLERLYQTKSWQPLPSTVVHSGDPFLDSLLKSQRVKLNQIRILGERLTATIAFALKKLYRGEYWERTWIIQEVLLAKQIEIMCGSKTAPWESFLLCADYLYQGPMSNVGDPPTARSSMPGRLNQQRMNRKNRKRLGRSASLRLETLLQEYPDTKCADLRDRIYALLSLADNRPRDSGLVPDYSKDPFELYVDVMHCCVNVECGKRFEFNVMIQDMLGLSEMPLSAIDLQCERRSSDQGKSIPLEVRAIQLGTVSKVSLLSIDMMAYLERMTGRRNLPPHLIWIQSILRQRRSFAEDKEVRFVGFATGPPQVGDVVIKFSADKTLLMQDKDLVGKAVMLDVTTAKSFLTGLGFPTDGLSDPDDMPITEDSFPRSFSLTAVELLRLSRTIREAFV
jgi:hypothetical protein